ncbi:hypothetical protein ACHQM5_001026 [Ranunculus cassubicifolius]
MGGKGQRRREKNYKAAHGGYSRLPPPPKPNEVDTMPSKLRKLIDFTTAPPPPPTKGGVISSIDKESIKNKNAEKKINPKDGSSPKGNISKVEARDGRLINNKHKDKNEKTTNEDARDKKKAKKRKREEVKDLRFGTTEKVVTTSTKRRDRKKKYLETKKNKHKKSQEEEGPEFPGHEDIKFGDIVDAPPKLLSIPKGVKKVQDASHERLRLQAIEAYRNRRGWGSRLGVSIPGIVQNQSA